MRKIFKILPFILLTIYLIVAFGFVSDERKNVVCSEINVVIKDSLYRSFYTPEDIRNILKREDLKLKGYPIYSLNIRKLESLFKDKPYIKNVDIYATSSGSLDVLIEQREAVLRIYALDNRSYYIDCEGNIMPESKNYIPYVIVANGYFPGGHEIQKAANIFNLNDREKYKAWFDVLELVKELNKDMLWKNQFVQIYLNRGGKFELIPRVGAHVIILGDINDIAEKLNKLKALYLKGFYAEGWNNYEKIDLRYKNQVVCTKR